MKHNAFTEWYGRLTPRDQQILRYGAVIVTVLLLLLVVLPMQRNLVQAREQLQQQESDLSEMTRWADVLAAAGPGRATANPNQSLVVLIDTTAQESGLAKALTGSTPSGNGAMRVQLENADFNMMVGWLNRLSTQQGIQVEDATVTGNGGAGLVNAAVQLRRGK